MKEPPEKLLKWLESRPKIQELRSMAKRLGVKLKRTMKKRDIIKKLKSAVETRIGERSRSSATSAPPQPERIVEKREERPRLPESYDKDKLVLLPVNPNWLYAYWDLSPASKRLVAEKAGSARFVIRIHDVTNLIFNGTNAHRTLEADVDLRWGNYYFQVPNPNADYLCQLGFLENGVFVPLLTSNVVRTPPAFPSDKKEEIWLRVSKGRRYERKSEGMVVRPIERAVGSSKWPGIGAIEEVSGGGAFIWRLVHGARSGGVR